jgi:hypothetical protein
VIIENSDNNSLNNSKLMTFLGVSPPPLWHPPVAIVSRKPDILEKREFLHSSGNYAKIKIKKSELVALTEKSP